MIAKKRRVNSAFTLIELLVVVAIIGILAAVGVVAYNGYTAAAKKNSSKHKVKIDFIQEDIQSLSHLNRTFDIIVSNPPYINSEGIPFIQREIREHEPQIALDGGVSGTDILFRLIKQANDKLSKDGYLAIEIGLGQEQEILDYCNRIFSRNAKIAVEKDLAGIPRVLLVKNSE